MVAQRQWGVANASPDNQALRGTSLLTQARTQLFDEHRHVIHAVAAVRNS
jgi:hypothetical protein